jgi:hypothetical protein
LGHIHPSTVAISTTSSASIASVLPRRPRHIALKMHVLNICSRCFIWMLYPMFHMLQ